MSHHQRASFSYAHFIATCLLLCSCALDLKHDPLQLDDATSARPSGTTRERVAPPDTDGDGFNDDDDPAPLDPTVPGDFSSPEAILRDPRIKRALAAAEDAGYLIRPSLDRSPVVKSGLSRTEDGAARFVATSNQTDVGRKVSGSESRITVYSDLSEDVASVSFTLGKPTDYSFSDGIIVRGNDSSTTTYSRNKLVCTLSGASFTIWSIGISARDRASSQFVSLSVTIDKSGTLTNACANYLGANLESVGGWTVVAGPSSTRITADQAEFLCVDGADAYVPTEQWTRKDGTPCECTEKYEVRCLL